jgi:quinone-modifying oxidoreductase, subunit QmoA
VSEVGTTLAESPRKLLVIGGGIAGLTAAIEAAEAGMEVVLVEREPHLGGRVAQMYQYFTKLCPPMCGLEINLRRVRSGQHITVHTQATVAALTGGPGKYRVSVRQAPRFVAERCSACGRCAEVCPAERASAFDFGMRKTKAAYLAYPGAWPPRYTIDRAVCLATAPHPNPLSPEALRDLHLPPCPRGFAAPSPASARGEGAGAPRPGASRGEVAERSEAGEGPCTLCADACPTHAIDLAAAPRTFDLEVAAVIWATGWQPYEPTRLVDLGFGACRDVITNMMLERLASPHGPTAGRVLCPSDGKAPASIAFVQCAGSRDEAHLAYCSGLCCMASAKHARYLRAQYPDAEITVYYIDRRAAGRHELFLAETERDGKVHFIPGKVARISAHGDDGKPVLEVEDTAKGSKLKHKVDLVVLAAGMVPSQVNEKLVSDRYGFLAAEQPSPGQLTAGCAREPMDVASAVRDATSAALRALGVGE